MSARTATAAKERIRRLTSGRFLAFFAIVVVAAQRP
jgi:hypothetical protein